jgi:hypothetical protein
MVEILVRYVILKRISYNLSPGVPEKILDADNWDGWPDGTWRKEYTPDEVKLTKEFAVNWACRTQGGNNHTKGSSDMDQGPRKRTRVCLGIIKCGNKRRGQEDGCLIVTRPHTRSKAEIEKQLDERCECGSKRKHYPCPGKAKMIITYSAGRAKFSHIGFHNHERPTDVIHLVEKERIHLQEMVLKDPKKGPLALAVELATSQDPPKPLLNKDRVAVERKRVLIDSGIRRSGKTDSFVQEFADFDAKHHEIIQKKVFGNVTVITLQSTDMRKLASQKAVHSSQSPTSGIITDGAHNFFDDKSTILIGSSVYNQSIKSWAPIALSYANGNSSNHYKIHFEAIFEGMAAEKERLGDKLKDENLAQV